MTEATVRDDAPTVNPSIEFRAGLRGIPAGLLCRAIDLRTEIHLSRETWTRWKAAGLPTLDLGADGELVLTDHLLQWAATKPRLPPSPKKSTKKPTKKGA